MQHVPRHDACTFAERSYTKGHVVIQLSDAEEFVAVGRFKSLMDECC